MRLIVVGAGRVGGILAEKLANDNHNITVIDKDEEILNSISNIDGVVGLLGSGINKEDLQSAGVEGVDFLFACTSEDELNILCCSIAKQMGAKHVAARVRSQECFNSANSLKEDLKIDLIFNPERNTAREIANILKFPSAIDVDKFSENVSLVELNVTHDNPMVNKSVVSIARETSADVIFAAVTRGGNVFIPLGDFVIEEDDHVHILGKDTSITNFTRKLHMYKQKSKNVIIVGGGHISLYLAEELLNNGVDVKIIEKDPDKCKQISEDLPQVITINGDGTDSDTLDEEGIKNCDACVSLTGSDAQNMVLSLYAKSLKVDKTITQIVDEAMLKMINKLDIELDTVLSPREVVADQLTKFVRSHQGDVGVGINTLYNIHEKAEALEFIVPEDFDKLNTPLKDIKFLKNVIIGGIIRDGEYTKASGDSVFKVNDKVIVITLVEQVNSLEDIIR